MGLRGTAHVASRVAFRALLLGTCIVFASAQAAHACHGADAKATLTGAPGVSGQADANCNYQKCAFKVRVTGLAPGTYAFQATGIPVCDFRVRRAGGSGACSGSLSQLCPTQGAVYDSEGVLVASGPFLYSY